MEVKPGYKQTEVGVIPEEWEVRPLLSTVRIANGQVSPKVEPYKSMVLVAPDHIESSTGRLLARETAAEQGAISGKYLFESGDIVYSKIRPYLRKAILADFSGLCSADMYPLRPATDISAGYILAVILGYRFSRFAESVSARSGMPKINRTEMAEFSLAVPALSEQRAIADALSDVDGLLGGLDRLIAKKRDLKQAAMQQLLTGQTRLPGFGGEWKLTNLRHLVTAERFAIVDGPFGTQLKVDEYVASGVPVIEMEHLSDDIISADLGRFITVQKFDALRRSAVYPFDIVISKTGSLGKLGIVPATIERALITSRLAKITLDPEKADYRFVLQFLLKLRRDSFWEKVSQGGTMQILGIGMLQNVPVPAITLAEQTAIADVLSEMDIELESLRRQRDKTLDLKQAMTQELLNGRTRLIATGAHA